MSDKTFRRREPDQQALFPPSTRDFRQFLRRGLANVAGEWALLCTVHNLLKLAAVCSE